MKKTKYFIPLIAVLLAGSCSVPKESEASLELFAMDTVISVKAFGEKSAEAVSAAGDRIAELEALFSVTEENSDIGRLNSAGSAKMSEDSLYVISEALGYCESTDGALDITIYPVLREWGFTTGSTHVPEDGAISAALLKTGWEKVAVSDDSVSLPEGFMLDLGSCAKGYAGEEMTEAMSELGIRSALVNLGGNVQALGKKPDGSEWSVGIANPFSPNELLGVLKIHDRAVITSGGYQRYFTDDEGNVYIHIIDPATGRPADSGLVSVSVIGEDGLMCDALSTSLFVMGKERAINYWRENGGFDMVLVDSEGRVLVTGGISDSFTCTSGLPVETINE